MQVTVVAYTRTHVQRVQLTHTQRHFNEPGAAVYGLSVITYKMAPHSMDLIIFGTGLLGAIILAIHLNHTLPKYTQYLQDSIQKQEATEADIETACRSPDHFSSSSVRYADTDCQTKFTNFLYGRSTPQEAGISAPLDDIPLEDDNSTNSRNTDAFATAMRVVQSDGPNVAELSGEDIRKGESYTSRMLSLFYVHAGLVIAGFVVAVCFSRVAQAQACYLEVAWYQASCSSSSATLGEHGGDEAALLEAGSSIVFRRLAALANSRKLAISYLVFLVSMLFIFVILGAIIVHGNGVVLKQTEKAVDMKTAAYEKYLEIRKDRAGESSGPNEGDKSDNDENNPQWETNPVTTEEPLSEIDQYVQELFRPQPTHDSGVFICNFQVRRLGNLQHYSVQCSYKVSRSANKPHPDNLNFDLLQVKQVMEAGSWVAFLMAVLFLIQILNVFLLSPRSIENSLSLAMKGLGVAAPSKGVGFAFTDLAFVAYFTPMGSRTKYSLGPMAREVELYNLRTKAV